MICCVQEATGCADKRSREEAGCLSRDARQASVTVATATSKSRCESIAMSHVTVCVPMNSAVSCCKCITVCQYHPTIQGQYLTRKSESVFKQLSVYFTCIFITMFQFLGDCHSPDPFIEVE